MWTLKFHIGQIIMFDLGEIILRKPERKDAESIFRNYTQDEEVSKYLIWRPHNELSVSESWINYCMEVFNPEKDLKLMIAGSDTDEAIGMIDAKVEGHQAVIGYVLARRYWGRGIMTRVLKRVLEELISRPLVFRVYATHDLDNPASGRVMEKAGMEFEGILRRASILPNVSIEPRDSKLYSIVK
jgi:RimJ/RimL family protein N-acetyltransferase